MVLINNEGIPLKTTLVSYFKTSGRRDLLIQGIRETVQSSLKWVLGFKWTLSTLRNSKVTKV